MKKAKVRCKAKKVGKCGVSLSISVKDKEVGSFDGDLRYEMISPSVAAVVLEKARQAEAELDSMEVGDKASIKLYVQTCSRLLTELLMEMDAALAAE